MKSNHSISFYTRIKQGIKNILFVSIPTFIFILLIIEIILHFLPISDHPTFAFEPEFKIRKFDPSWKSEGNHSIGKFCKHPSTWNVNNQGWINKKDYLALKNKHRIAVIGDSYVQAMQVNSNEAFHQILETELDSFDVYSFGISGAPLSQYYHMAKYAQKHFQPDIYIFNLIHNDFDESLSSLNGDKREFWTLTAQNDSTFTWRAPIDRTQNSSLKSFIKRSAIFRYLNYNINIRAIIVHQRTVNAMKKNGELDTMLPFEDNINVSQLIREQKKISESIQFIFQEIAQTFKGKKIIVLMDGQREFIYKNKLAESNTTLLNQMVKEASLLENFDYIDLSPLFEQDYKENKTSFNFEEDYHWNEYGHHFVAQILKKHLTQVEIK